jgi:rhamnose utilization protein RhaD (predicted bifunctional aldolase and dehydrogenase)
MQSLWNDEEAANFKGELGLRVYASRLLGREDSLVLYGGGNTSVKIEDTLYVKGSGIDLAAVDEGAFTPLKLACVRELLERGRLDNAEMMRLLERCLAHRPAPKPSIETLLHAGFPYRHVEHTHADSVLAVVNTENGVRIAAEVFGDLAPLVPYRHSGFELARACRQVLRDSGTRRTIGLILHFHGVVAFGDSARESYKNMIRLVTLAEDYLKSKRAWDIAVEASAIGRADPAALEALRAAASRAAGFPLVMVTVQTPLCTTFARRPDVHIISQQGPATPQHAVYTKRIPLLGGDVEAFAAGYRAYLQRTLGEEAGKRIDPAPRIVLDAGFGMCALGIDARHAQIAADFYCHDIAIMMRAGAHDAYRSAPERAIAAAELEYGGFEAGLHARVRS